MHDLERGCVCMWLGNVSTALLLCGDVDNHFQSAYNLCSRTPCGPTSQPLNWRARRAEMRTDKRMGMPLRKVQALPSSQNDDQHRSRVPGLTCRKYLCLARCRLPTRHQEKVAVDTQTASWLLAQLESISAQLQCTLSYIAELVAEVGSNERMYVPQPWVIGQGGVLSKCVPKHLHPTLVNTNIQQDS